MLTSKIHPAVVQRASARITPGGCFLSVRPPWIDQDENGEFRFRVASCNPSPYGGLEFDFRLPLNLGCSLPKLNLVSYRCVPVIRCDTLRFRMAGVKRGVCRPRRRRKFRSSFTASAL